MGLIDKLIPAIPWVQKENSRFINKLRDFDEDRWKFIKGNISSNC